MAGALGRGRGDLRDWEIVNRPAKGFAPQNSFFAQIAEQNGFDVVEVHEVRTKRTGTSIVNSSVRAGTVKKQTRLYETTVELRAS